MESRDSMRTDGVVVVAVFRLDDTPFQLSSATSSPLLLKWISCDGTLSTFIFHFNATRAMH